jgi:hypothetical protein
MGAAEVCHVLTDIGLFRQYRAAAIDRVMPISDAIRFAE